MNLKCSIDTVICDSNKVGGITHPTMFPSESLSRHHFNISISWIIKNNLKKNNIIILKKNKTTDKENIS